MKRFLMFSVVLLASAAAHAESLNFESVRTSFLKGTPEKCDLRVTNDEFGKGFLLQLGKSYKFPNDHFYGSASFRPADGALKLVETARDNAGVVHFRIEAKPSYVYGGGFIPLPLDHKYEHWKLEGYYSKADGKVLSLAGFVDGWRDYFAARERLADIDCKN